MASTSDQLGSRSDAGSMLCAKCRQVKYCSKGCQTAHWMQHKSTCNSPYAADKWVPNWMQEDRRPSFVTTGPTNFDTFGLGARRGGHYLWGNIFAYDLLNIAANEGSASKNQDFSLCFAASGDIRNVVKSINNLPSDYKGTCTIVINDMDRYVAIRNLLFLCMLCNTAGPGPEETAEAMVHLFYSAALTEHQSVYLASWMRRLFDRTLPDEAPCVIDAPSLTGTSDVCFFYPRDTMELGKDILESSYSWLQAKKDMTAVRFAEFRIDYQDRRIANLRPRHRVAHIQWKTSGIVLPIGESTHNFNRPNRPKAEYLLLDNAGPFTAWNPLEIEKTRQRLNLPEGDLYGSMFFHVKSELTEFASRARRFKLKFYLYAMDLQQLAPMIQLTMPTGSAPLTFDRIDASNVLDTLGIPKMLQSLGHLLNKSNPHSAFFMYSMNWIRKVSERGTPEEARSPAHMQALSKLIDRANIRKITKTPQNEKLLPYTVFRNNWACFDIEPKFTEFKEQQGLKEACHSAGLKERRAPRIHSKRYGVPIGRDKAEPDISGGVLYQLGKSSIFMEKGNNGH
ncbi:hypothetical protein FRB98_005286 [Tulasnella sp. 332]|nr:hypothetical protein FRB98_005286 [Tulasnella sp. 332]